MSIVFTVLAAQQERGVVPATFRYVLAPWTPSPRALNLGLWMFVGNTSDSLGPWMFVDEIPASST